MARTGSDEDERKLGSATLSGLYGVRLFARSKVKVIQDF